MVEEWFLGFIGSVSLVFPVEDLEPQDLLKLRLKQLFDKPTPLSHKASDSFRSSTFVDGQWPRMMIDVEEPHCISFEAGLQHTKSRSQDSIRFNQGSPQGTASPSLPLRPPYFQKHSLESNLELPGPTQVGGAEVTTKRRDGGRGLLKGLRIWLSTGLRARSLHQGKGRHLN